MIEKDAVSVFNGWSERVSDKALEIQTVEDELAGLASRLADTTGAKERQALIARRAELVNLRGALGDELECLRERKASAFITTFESREEELRREFDVLAGEFAQRRKEFENAQNALANIVNHLPEDGKQDDYARQRVKFENAKAAAEVELQLAHRKFSSIESRYKLALEATERAKREVGKQ